MLNEGTGSLDASTLRSILEACLDECSLRLSSDAVNELADSLLEEAGSRTEVTYDQLEQVLRKRPGIVEGFTKRLVNLSDASHSCYDHLHSIIIHLFGNN